ncbi:MAG: SH3 domain-containing protein [Chloroflexi bacterium]|nr:SH3 domain-containing protein [Chloroflexota bacterium]
MHAIAGRRTCPTCGESNPAARRQCAGCGALLARPNPEPPVAGLALGILVLIALSLGAVSAWLTLDRLDRALSSAAQPGGQVLLPPALPTAAPAVAAIATPPPALPTATSAAVYVPVAAQPGGSTSTPTPRLPDTPTPAVGAPGASPGPAAGPGGATPASPAGRATPTPTVAPWPASPPPTPSPTTPPPEPPTPTPGAPEATPAPEAAPPEEPTPTPVPQPPTQRGILASDVGGNVVVRARPTTASAQVGALPVGTEVEVLGRVAGEAISPGDPFWYEIRRDRLRGFVYGRLIVLRR